LTAMLGKLTLVQVPLAPASDALASAPPKSFAYSFAPVAPLPLIQTLNVYMPFGRLATAWSRLPVSASCHDQRPVCPPVTLVPPLLVHPAGVVIATRSASKL